MGTWGKWTKRAGALVVAIVLAIGVALVGSAVHLFPQLRNPFAETTTETSGPVLLQSIVQLSRYEAASGNFQVVVNITSKSWLPGFLQGSDTLFVGVGTDNAFVDFSNLKGSAVVISPDHTTATITLPHAQLETAELNTSQSYVVAQQQGIFTKVNSALSGNPNSQQAAYELATKDIGTAAASSPLKADAERNTKVMLTSLLQSLGYKTITINFV